MQLEETLAITRAMGDRSRLLIMRALTAGPLCAEEIAETLGLVPSTVSFHVKKLLGAGLLTVERDQYYTVYRLQPDLLGITLGELLGVGVLCGPLREKREAGERQRVLGAFFRDGRLLKMPAQKKKRTVVLEEFARLFRPGAVYQEREADALIAPVFADYCAIRRLLVEEGYLRRARGEYERTEKPCAVGPPASGARGEMETTTRGAAMDGRKKILREAYKSETRQAGVFRITNTVTNKVFLGSTLNLHGPLNRLEFELQQGVSRIPGLQEDYRRYGQDAFTFEVVEVIEPREDPEFNMERELETVERRYADALDRGNTYNQAESIRFLKARNPVRT